MDAIKELKEYDGYILSEQYKIRHRVIQEIKQLRLANSDLQMHYDHARTECDKLREALREIYEVYAGSEGIPQPMTAAEGYLLSLLMEVVRIAQNALKEKE